MAALVGVWDGKAFPLGFRVYCVYDLGKDWEWSLPISSGSGLQVAECLRFTVGALCQQAT